MVNEDSNLTTPIQRCNLLSLC